MNGFAAIGRRVPKKDAPEKVSGCATYGQDVKLPGMLHGAIRYSDHAHARILKIDAAKAKALEGVKCVVTADDAPETRFGFYKDNMPLKKDSVRSCRDEIAGVVAVNEMIARQAVKLIEIEYEPLPAVFTTAEALAVDAPLLHPEKGSNHLITNTYKHGDVAKGEAESDVVVELACKLPYVNHASMETSVVVARFDNKGHLTLWSTTQIPFLLQRDLGEALGIPPRHIRIIQPTIGGAFGRELDIYPYHPIAAIMARKARAPVRLCFSREEEFRAGPQRQPVNVNIRAGARENGDLTFRDVTMQLDVGAYGSWGSTTPLVMMETTASFYRVPHVRFQADCVYTHNLVTGAMRGYGNPQSSFYVESVMDMLAEKLGMDPIQFRIHNANQPNTVTEQGLRITSCGMEECLNELAKKAQTELEPSAQQHLKRGRGVGGTLNVGGGARIYRSDGCGATVKVDDFGHVSLITGSTEIGQGSETVLAQMVAEVMGVPVDDVRVINTDTDVKTWDVGVHASRTTFIAGNAACLAAKDALRQIFETAGEILCVLPDSLAAKDGKIFAPDGKSVSLSKVVRSRHFRTGGEMVFGKAFYDPKSELVDKQTYHGNISPAYGFGMQMADVEVDTETGQVRVLKLVCAKDVGRAINPMAVEGQIEGGVQMGLGYALSEELVVEEGRVMNPNFVDYRLFTAADMPEIENILIESVDPEGPFGAKGIGEMGSSCVAAAVVNAIYDAVGVRLTHPPMTPERVLAALDAKRGE
ncbi:MAG: xanthine dehydrogenase family protein molybdopterin-binding subunit [Nitrospinaceae bacterium]|nr:xanthine dehydrogenase family protein molybdopterin-binding subunit [Nitrospinaceae bacterium]MDP6734877.1 xanthine dehydrogenase family protein molybdopterin-binding subunit [Nitrospinaceae bacterium]